MDIILMCLKQQEELKQFFDNFYLEKLYTDGEQNDYCSDIFTVLNCWNGTMYSVFSKNSYDKNDIIAGSIDIFDYIDFDLTKPKGSINITLNGENTPYTASIKDGDVIEVFWS